MRLRPYRPIAVLLLALHLGGCYRWEIVGPVSPRSEIGDVRVTLTDGAREVLENAATTAAGDSLYAAGVPESCERIPGADLQLRCQRASAFALADIRLLERQRIHPLRTAAFVVVLAPVALLGALAVSGGVWDGTW